MDDDGAIIVGNYRYLLWRTWDVTRPCLLWIMLNPSNADETRDDPTLKSCKRISRCRGYGRLEIVNLFAYRTPRPTNLSTLTTTVNRVGDQNDCYVDKAVSRATDTVVAWGAMGGEVICKERVYTVLKILSRHPNKRLYCLGLTYNGSPRHPLYVKGDAELKPYITKCASTTAPYS